MRIHLYTTDISGLALCTQLTGNDAVTAIFVPGNRIGSDKVRAICDHGGLPAPIRVHERGDTSLGNAPPADAVVSWMYSQILSADLLAAYPRGGLNMHGGKLPDYRGANVLNWAIANGETTLGVTWHAMAQKVDAGAIFAESEIPIGETDTAWSMRAQMLDEGIRIFPEAWHRFGKGEPPIRVPDLEQGRVWPSRRAEHGRIGAGWSESAVRNLVRAQIGPWPPATVFDGTDWLPVLRVSETPGEDSLAYVCDTGKILHLHPQ